MPLARGTADELFSRGVAYFQQNEFDAALTAYSEALRLKPRDAEIRVYAPQALIALGRKRRRRSRLQSYVL